MAVEVSTDARRLSVDSASSKRSTTWSDDVQKGWNMPILSAETQDHRFQRYCEYFSLNDVQIQHVYKAFLSELELGLSTYNPLTNSNASTLPMIDTFITELPTGDEIGTAYATTFSIESSRSVRARLEGKGKIVVAEVSLPAGDIRNKNVSALELFDFVGASLVQVLQKTGETGKNAPLGFAIPFSCDHRGLRSATLVKWSKGFETGRTTADPVEGNDVVTMFDMALWRKNSPMTVTACINDAVATLLACCYEKPPRLPPCTVSIILGSGLNGAYVDRSAIRYGYKGIIINTELGGYNKGLPITDVDLEVDYADEAGRSQQMFEKMVSGAYLGEVCRRLIVKVWQDTAPPQSWTRRSMPTIAATTIVRDVSPDLSITQKLLYGLWDWDTSVEIRRQVQRLFTLVFDRSAGLAAVAVAALAKKSGRLQPAMGGVTVAIDASLHAAQLWYGELVKSYLVRVIGSESAKYVQLFLASDGPVKGAAICALMETPRQHN